jgi:HEAT repeat protein
MNSLVRQQVLTSIAETRHDVARELLVRVAKEPPAEGSLQDKQETLDRRLNAIRGLGGFPHPESTAALVHILKHERDTALRDRAHESLKRATGKNLPADAAAWEELLQPRPMHPDGPAIGRSPIVGQNTGGIGDWLMRNVWQKK